MTSASKVFFRPWIGPAYSKGRERLLVLGEAHYGSDPHPDDTFRWCGQYVQGDPPGDGMTWSFWTRVARFVGGPDLPLTECRELWKRIAFYNYVQEMVGESAGIAPTQDAFERATPAFFEVLNEFRPTHVLALSNRLWDNMPEFHDGITRILSGGGTERDYGRYKAGNGLAYAMSVPHPSRSSAAKWFPVVQAFLSMK